MQDIATLNNPLAVRKYLESEQVEYDPADAPRTLRGMAKRRMKRRLNEVTSPDAQRSLFQASNALTVSELKDIVAAMSEAAVEADKHYKMKCQIESLPPDFLKTKHNVGSGDICRGVVYNGKCFKCKQFGHMIADCPQKD